MERCEQYQKELETLAVSGSENSTEDSALQAHLTSCPDCRAELARLRHAERYLRDWPRVSPPVHLANRIMATILRQPVEEWRILPLGIWLPALAILGGICIVLLATPVSLSGAPLQVDLAKRTVIEIENTQVMGQVGQQLFWAVWCGIAISLGGLGIALGLSAKSTTMDQPPWRDRLAGLLERAHERRSPWRV